MEIHKRQFGPILELRVKGRLDSYWAGFFGSALTELIHGGAHHLRLDLSELDYLSSAGIGVLVQFYKRLVGIHGSLAVVSASERVTLVLRLTGLDAILGGTAAPPVAAAAAAALVRSVERENAKFEFYPAAPTKALACRVLGNPELLAGFRFGPEHARTLRCPESGFALGLGAFGSSFEECRNRFGEFLAVAGCAAHLPTDGSNVPDYMIAEKTFVPSIETLYALACEGEFASLVRFEARKEAGAASLGEIVDACLEAAGSPSVGIVMLAESPGLCGTALRRSPALAAADDAPFAFPGIREWLSFSPERVHGRSVCLVAGIATRSPHDALRPIVRALGKDASPASHFHAAAFSYRPLQRGEIDLKKSVHLLFQEETLQAVLHLLRDDRHSGVGESEFARGACWVGPIQTVTAEGN
ncbi:MAG TPA: STAS domain-containing protein [Candidatus Acidoferrales bacterium]|nr:STAS domain-containing protein [Candidatus Acidoferrales bacterium]